MSAPKVNACTFCKRGKRKCNKTRPSCSNCMRLRKTCVYLEDTFKPHYEDGPARAKAEPPRQGLLDPYTPALLQQSTSDVALHIMGSPANMAAVADDFFTGTHQRMSPLSKMRFMRSFPSLAAGTPSPEYAALCLTIILVQQYPHDAAEMTTPLYLATKNMLSLLDAASGPSLDLLQCKLLVCFYEMGHGLHHAGYLSVAACARTARSLGLHRKPWRGGDVPAERMLLAEEHKRIWWAILSMERITNLSNGDALFATEDAVRTDALPIDDLVWSEGASVADLETLIAHPPTLETPFNITVGQMARECQIAHLAGLVIRHVFEPTHDEGFNAEEAVQLERTLNSYLPLLANEELRIGKYCGAFGLCNSALFTLYELMLRRCTGDAAETQRIQQAVEQTSLRAITFAEASYADREENYPIDIFSPYLPYSLYQSAAVQLRLWRQTGDVSHRRHVDSLKTIIGCIALRWRVACQYLDTLNRFEEGEWPSVVIPFQGSYISTWSGTI